MKPDSLKCLLNSYLKERITSEYDEVDGIWECAGEPSGAIHDRQREFSDLFLQQATPTLPQLYHDELSPEDEAIVRRVGRQLSQLSDEFEGNRSRSASFDSQPDATANNCVKFRTRCIFVSPNEDTAKIIVVRTGNVHEAVQVRWETVDNTAKLDVHYIGSSGSITFAEGETEKTIEVEILRHTRDRNISFIVNLFDPEGTEIGSDNPLTVYIVDHSNFVPVERQVVDNIMNCPPNASASEVAICLYDELTPNTFRAALQYRCSYFDSLHYKLSFAFELVKLSMEKASLETLGDVVCKFFDHLPELEDISEAFN